MGAVRAAVDGCPPHGLLAIALAGADVGGTRSACRVGLGARHRAGKIGAAADEEKCGMLLPETLTRLAGSNPLAR